MDVEYVPQITQNHFETVQIVTPKVAIKNATSISLHRPFMPIFSLGADKLTGFRLSQSSVNSEKPGLGCRLSARPRMSLIDESHDHFVEIPLGELSEKIEIINASTEP